MKNVSDIIEEMERIESELVELKRCCKSYIEVNGHPNIDGRIWDVTDVVYRTQFALANGLEEIKGEF
jgi:hypothetical protein